MQGSRLLVGESLKVFKEGMDSFVYQFLLGDSI